MWIRTEDPEFPNRAFLSVSCLAFCWSVRMNEKSKGHAEIVAQEILLFCWNIYNKEQNPQTETGKSFFYFKKLFPERDK